MITQPRRSLTALFLSLQILALAVTCQQADGAAPAKIQSRCCALDASNKHDRRAIAPRVSSASSGRRTNPLLSLTLLHRAPPPSEVEPSLRPPLPGQTAVAWRERARPCAATLFPPPLPRHHSPWAFSERDVRARPRPCVRAEEGKGRKSEARRRGCGG